MDNDPWPDRPQEIRRRDLIPPPVNISDLRPDEFMTRLTVILAGGNEVSFPCLFSRDWPHRFCDAKFAEGTGLPIIRWVQSYWTPCGRIGCTRAIRLLVKPAGWEDFVPVLLSILETERYGHLNLPIIMGGQPAVSYFLGQDWPYLNGLQPLIHLDFTPRQSNTFPSPGTPELMAAAGFDNTSAAAWSPPSYVPSQQLQVGFLQAGYPTFAPSGELARLDQTRLWVEENNNNNSSNTFPEDVVDG